MASGEVFLNVKKLLAMLVETSRLKVGIISYNSLSPNPFGVRKGCFGVVYICKLLIKPAPRQGIVVGVVGSVKSSVS